MNNILCDIDRLTMEGFSEKEAIEMKSKEQTNFFNKYGFLFHIVLPSENRLFFNAHTHGLPDKYNHPDIEILIPLEETLQDTKEWISHILNTLIDRIEYGHILTDGEKLKGYIKGMYCETILINKKNGRKVFRFLMPDMNGYLPTDDKCDKKFKIALTQDMDEREYIINFRGGCY